MVADLARGADVVWRIRARHHGALRCDYPARRGEADLVYCSISASARAVPCAGGGLRPHRERDLGVMHLEQQRRTRPPSGTADGGRARCTHAFGVILRRPPAPRTHRSRRLPRRLMLSLWRPKTSHAERAQRGAAYPGPRPGMGVHAVGGRTLALQSVGAPISSRACLSAGAPTSATTRAFMTLTHAARTGPSSSHASRMADTFKTWTSVLSQRARIPARPLLSPEEGSRSPHLHARGAFTEVRTRRRQRAHQRVPFHVEAAARAGRPRPTAWRAHARRTRRGAGYADRAWRSCSRSA